MCVCVCVCVCVSAYIRIWFCFFYIYALLPTIHTSRKHSRCNDYCHRKQTHQWEFKSWTEPLCISHSSHSRAKCIHQTIFPPAMNEWLSRLHFLTLVWQPVQEKENWIQTNSRNEEGWALPGYSSLKHALSVALPLALTRCISCLAKIYD